jgi:hypothetical protein
LIQGANACYQLSTTTISFTQRSVAVINRVFCPYICDLGEVGLVFFTVSVNRLELRFVRSEQTRMFLHKNSVYNPIHRIQCITQYLFVHPPITERRGHGTFLVGLCHFGAQPTTTRRTEKKVFLGGLTGEVCCFFLQAILYFRGKDFRPFWRGIAKRKYTEFRCSVVSKTNSNKKNQWRPPSKKRRKEEKT